MILVDFSEIRSKCGCHVAPSCYSSHSKAQFVHGIKLVAYKIKHKFSSGAKRSQTASERQVAFLIDDLPTKKYSYRIVCTPIQLFNTRKVLKNAHVSQILVLIGL